MNYWYSARPNEIFLDLDSNRAIARALSVLRLAILQKKLDVRAVWLFKTKQAHHAHLMIVTRWGMSTIVKAAWELWCGGDRLRAGYILMRFHDQIEHTSLLVAGRRYHRDYDALCICKEKHKESSVTDKCPAMMKLLGKVRSADYFARTGERPPKGKIRIPWGRLSLKTIKEWKCKTTKNKKRKKTSLT